MKEKTFKELFDEGKGDFVCPHCNYESVRDVLTVITKNCGMCGKYIFHL